MLDEEYLFVSYRPWDLLLQPFENMSPAEARLMYREFLALVDERADWWLRTARQAGMRSQPDSNEFIVEGWRVVKDGYSEQLGMGKSGGIFYALAFDWSVHSSEVLRKRFDLKWGLAKPKSPHENYPELSGFTHAHRTYTVSLVRYSQHTVTMPDLYPPFPIRQLATATKAATGIEVDLDKLSYLGLPPVPRSYIAGEPPSERTRTKSDLPDHANADSRPPVSTVPAIVSCIHQEGMNCIF